MDSPPDVQIMLSSNLTLNLHANTLARCSGFFKEHLTERHAAKLNNKAKKGGVRIRWMFELEKPTDEHPMGFLKKVDLKRDGTPVDEYIHLTLNMNRVQHTHIEDAWKVLLKSFNHTLIPIEANDLELALRECIQLIQIAEALQCVEIVGIQLEASLLKYGQVLFRRIQINPAPLMNMAFRLRSELIFRECIVHLVGTWNSVKEHESVKNAVDQTPGAKQLIEKYHGYLQERCRKLENDIVNEFPGDMARPQNCDIPVKSEIYGKDILLWMALTFFKNWFGAQLVNCRGYVSLDGGYALYRELAAGRDGYLNRSTVTQFYVQFPITRRSQSIIQSHLNTIKDWMQAEIVKKTGIMDSCCQLNVLQYPVDYLTCTQFERNDYPWIAGEGMNHVVEGMASDSPQGIQGEDNTGTDN